MNKQFTLLSFLLLACLSTNRAAGIAAGAEADPTGRTDGSGILTVREAIQAALTHSPQISIAEAQAARAGETLREMRSLNRPQLVVGTGLAYNNGMPLSIEGAAPSIFQMGLSQSIFSKKNNNLIKEAREAGKALKLGTDSARNELASKTALIYCSLYESRRIAAISSAGLEAARKQQLLAETLYETGKMRQIDVDEAATATASAEQQALVAREQVLMAEAELRKLTGLPDSTRLEIEEPKIGPTIMTLPEETLYQQALERAPEILQAEADAKAKEFHIEAEKGEWFPKFDIVSQYALLSRANNYDDYFNRFTRNNYLIGVSIQVPLFDGFRTKARVAQSRQEAAESNHYLQALKDDLHLNIKKNLSALRIARGAYELARKEAKEANEKLNMSEALLAGGRIDTKECEEARSFLRQKEVAQIEAEQTLFQRQIELLRVTGAMSAAFQ